MYIILQEAVGKVVSAMGAIDSKENGPENMDDMPLLSRLLAQERHVPDLPEYGLYNTIYA